LSYQKVGVRWLLQAWKSQQNVILADEMGLGKTVQAIAFISELVYTHKITRPFLVAVPLSTINNWKREFEFWLPEVNVLMYHGKGAARKIARELLFYHDLNGGNG
jgi:SNF2 family DNA or RNA helicase